MTDLADTSFTLSDLQAASLALLGRTDAVDPHRVDCPALDDEQFENAKKLAHFVHKTQFDEGFKVGAGYEVISLLIATELLSLHARNTRPTLRDIALSSIIAKALVHAKSLTDAYDAGKFRAAKTRLDDGTVIDGEITGEPSSLTRH